MSTWTFLSNHAHVLVAVASSPMLRLREIAEHVGITERAVQKILADLEQAGFVRRFKDGRRNRYEVDASAPLRHPLESQHTVKVLIAANGKKKMPKAAAEG